MKDPNTYELTVSQPSARLGKLMLVAAWAVGLALLSLFFHGYLDNAQNPNRKLTVSIAGESHEVTLRGNRLGHYVAPGTINGQPVTFLIDTGASAVALPLELARQLALPLRPGGRTKTANGIVDSWSTRIDQLAIGGLSARNIHAIVLPNMPGNQVLLGMTFLRGVELIQRDDILTLRTPQ